MVNQKQKKQLKALAHHLKPVVLIGKEGVSDTVIDSVALALEAHQLIKVRVSANAPKTVNEVAVLLSVATKATIIQTIGRMIVLYLPSNDKKQWLI